MKTLKQLPIKFLLINLLCITFALSGCVRKGKRSKNNLNEQVLQSHQLQSKVDFVEAEEKVMNNVVYFEFDDDRLPGSVAHLLSDQLKALSLNDNLNVVIEGHCDRVGPREYNLGLGARRAESVKRYFISCGVPAEKIETISFGKEKLSSFGTTPEDDAKNRRAIIILKDVTKE